jgi:hypothetical protein
MGGGGAPFAREDLDMREPVTNTSATVTTNIVALVRMGSVEKEVSHIYFQIFYKTRMRQNVSENLKKANF